MENETQSNNPSFFYYAMKDLLELVEQELENVRLQIKAQDEVWKNEMIEDEASFDSGFDAGYLYGWYKALDWVLSKIGKVVTYEP